jgi:DNA-binding NarL/FixJ family response regulator
MILPAKPEVPAVAPEATTAVAPAAEPPPQRDAHGRIRVVIADDHAVVRQGLKQILASEEDFVVVGEARNIAETLACTREVEWDVLVLDYSMPGGNGLLALKSIKQAHPRRPVLILSMHPEDTIAVSALRAGAAGYMNKDCASDELTLALRKAAAGKKYVSSSLAERLAVEIEEGAEGLPHEMLSGREYRVMWMLAAGKSITQIAEELNLSPNTVSTYRVRILKKLKLHNNADIVRYAVKHGLLQ